MSTPDPGALPAPHPGRTDEQVVVALVRQREDQVDLDLQAVAELLGERGWPEPRAAAATRRAVRSGALYEDCRHALHAVR